MLRHHASRKACPCARRAALLVRLASGPRENKPLEGQESVPCPCIILICTTTRRSSIPTAPILSMSVSAAREHAAGVARELTANSFGFLDQSWSEWTMRVRDDGGLELF